MRKAVILLTVILISICVMACSGPKEEETQPTVSYAAQNTNKEISEFDYDAAYMMCKDLLRNYYEATMSGKSLDMSRFIINKDFQQYVEMKAKHGKILTEKKIAISYGLTAINWNYDKKYGFLQLTSEVREEDNSGFAEGHQFLICNNNGTLVIADWLSEGLGTPAGLDDTVRTGTNKIGDPNFWDNQKLADDLLKKASSLVNGN